jgi:hypothetical protein
MSIKMQSNDKNVEHSDKNLMDHDVEHEIEIGINNGTKEKQDIRSCTIKDGELTIYMLDVDTIVDTLVEYNKTSSAAIKMLNDCILELNTDDELQFDNDEHKIANMIKERYGIISVKTVDVKSTKNVDIGSLSSRIDEGNDTHGGKQNRSKNKNKNRDKNKTANNSRNDKNKSKNKNKDKGSSKSKNKASRKTGNKDKNRNSGSVRNLAPLHREITLKDVTTRQWFIDNNFKTVIADLVSEIQILKDEHDNFRNEIRLDIKNLFSQILSLQNMILKTMDK